MKSCGSIVKEGLRSTSVYLPLEWYNRRGAGMKDSGQLANALTAGVINVI